MRIENEFSFEWFYKNLYICKMQKEITVNDFSKYLFWDVDLNGFDFQKHKVHLIQKV